MFSNYPIIFKQWYTHVLLCSYCCACAKTFTNMDNCHIWIPMSRYYHSETKHTKSVIIVYGMWSKEFQSVTYMVRICQNVVKLCSRYHDLAFDAQIYKFPASVWRRVIISDICSAMQCWIKYEWENQSFTNVISICDMILNLCPSCPTLHCSSFSGLRLKYQGYLNYTESQKFEIR